MPPPLSSTPITASLRLEREAIDKIDTYTRRVQAMQIVLHLGTQKGALVLKAEKISEVPRLKAIQDEMCVTVAAMLRIYNKIDGLAKALKRAVAGEPEPEFKDEIKEGVKVEVEVKDAEEVKIKKEIKTEDT